MEREVIDRLLARVTICTATGCWRTSGWDDGKGYKKISVNGTDCMAHRVMWEWFYRRKVGRLQLDHTCTTRDCCNPLHLRRVTNKTNSRLRSKRAKQLKRVSCKSVKTVLNTL